MKAWRLKPDMVLVMLLVGMAGFHVLTMPSKYYPGDNFAPRLETAQWLITGRLGVDYSWRPRLGGFLEQRGQYLFENDAKQLFYSKYGIGYTLLYVPPLLAEKLYAGTVDAFRGSRTQILFLNLYQILFTLGAATYLYRLASRYTQRRWLCLVFVLLSVYTTMLWHYLRAPTSEIFQILPFLGFCYHALRYIEGRTAGEDGKTWRQLSLALGWAGFLVLLKASFVLLFGAMWLFALLTRPRAESGASRPGILKSFVSVPIENLRKDFKRYLVWLVLPSVFFAAVLLSVNCYKFGDPFESGYQQWQHRNGSGDFMKYSLGFIPGALKDFFLWGRPSSQAFIYYPLFAFALLGMWGFFKRHGRDALFLGFVFISNTLAMCSLSFSDGEWCYGPRYLLHMLAIGSLPFITLCEFVLRMKWRAAVGTFLAVVLTAVSVWSCQMQWSVNSLHYFTFHYASSLMGQTAKSIEEAVLKQVPADQKGAWEERLSAKRKEISRYYWGAFHRGNIHREIVSHVEEGTPYPPIEIIKEMLPPQQREQAGAGLSKALDARVQRNFWLFD